MGSSLSTSLILEIVTRRLRGEGPEDRGEVTGDRGQVTEGQGRFRAMERAVADDTWRKWQRRLHLRARLTTRTVKHGPLTIKHEALTIKHEALTVKHEALTIKQMSTSIKFLKLEETIMNQTQTNRGTMFKTTVAVLKDNQPVWSGTALFVTAVQDFINVITAIDQSAQTQETPTIGAGD